MKLLFDASALLNLVRAAGAGALTYLRGNYILTLTPYEVGNALWKEATLLKRLKLGEAIELLNSMKQVYQTLNIITPHDTVTLFRLANKLRITYYDASYILAAREEGAELITDDGKLLKRVEAGKDTLQQILGKEVPVSTTSELVKSKQQ